jgi:hypothetical protein
MSSDCIHTKIITIGDSFMYPRHIYAHAILSLLLLSSVESNAIKMPSMPKIGQKEFCWIGGTVVAAATLLGLAGLTKRALCNMKLSSYNKGIEAMQKHAETTAIKKVMDEVLPEVSRENYVNEDGSMNFGRIRENLERHDIIEAAALRGKAVEIKQDWRLYERNVKGQKTKFFLPSWAFNVTMHVRGHGSVFDKENRDLSASYSVPPVNLTLEDF